MRSGWGSAWALASVVALGACEDDSDPYALSCREYIPGESISPEATTTSASHVIVQAAADASAAVDAASVELASMCASIAVELGADRDVIDGALTQTDHERRVVKACAAAVDAIKHHPVAPATELPVTCTTASGLVAACLKQCVPASDGCTVACDVSARAGAECPMPADARFGRLVALRARVAFMAEKLGELKTAETANVAVKASCIPVVLYSAQTSKDTADALLAAADGVIASTSAP